MRTVGENRASELRLKPYAQAEGVTPLNASEQDTSAPATKSSQKRAFFIAEGVFKIPLTNMTFSHICSAECPGLIG